MIRSLVSRLSLLEQLTVIAAVIAFGSSAWIVTAEMMKSERQSMVNATAVRLARAFDDELAEESDSLVAARGTVEDGMQAGLQVEVRDRAGRLLASSGSYGMPRSARQLPTTSVADSASIAHAESRSGAMITVIASDAAQREALTALWRSLLIAALPILVLSLLLGRTVATRALRPLSTMAERAVSFPVAGHPRTLGPRSGLAEVDRLAAAFDRLLERLDDAMRAERRLTADASHELRTPLTVLGGELELLLEQTPPNSREALAVRRAADHVRAMRELVDAILLLHRSGEAGSADTRAFEVINLGDLSRETLADTRVRYPGRDGDVQFSTPDEVLVEGHSALLAGAVRNLIDNALKFTKATDVVQVVVSTTADKAVLSVDDQGPGIRADERERIFDPFYRGAEARAGASGFGLGLPIMRRVARAHGGEVTVAQSALGGARFELWLPRLDPMRAGGPLAATLTPTS